MRAAYRLQRGRAVGRRSDHPKPPARETRPLIRRLNNSFGSAMTMRCMGFLLS